MFIEDGKIQTLGSNVPVGNEAETFHENIPYTLWVMSRTKRKYYTSWILGKGSKFKNWLTRVVILVRDKLYWFDLATREISWIYSIRFRCYEQDMNFQHYTAWILRQGRKIPEQNSKNRVSQSCLLSSWHMISIWFSHLWSFMNAFHTV